MKTCSGTEPTTHTQYSKKTAPGHDGRRGSFNHHVANIARLLANGVREKWLTIDVITTLSIDSFLMTNEDISISIVMTIINVQKTTYTYNINLFFKTFGERQKLER